MQVQVEHCAGHLGVELPVRFRFDGREVKSPNTSISGMGQTIATSRSKATIATCTFCGSTRVVWSGS
jgi:hypothetical protein